MTAKEVWGNTKVAACKVREEIGEWVGVLYWVLLYTLFGFISIHCKSIVALASWCGVTGAVLTGSFVSKFLRMQFPAQVSEDLEQAIYTGLSFALMLAIMIAIAG